MRAVARSEADEARERLAQVARRGLLPESAAERLETKPLPQLSKASADDRPHSSSTASRARSFVHRERA